MTVIAKYVVDLGGTPIELTREEAQALCNDLCSALGFAEAKPLRTPPEMRGFADTQLLVPPGVTQVGTGLETPAQVADRLAAQAQVLENAQVPPREGSSRIGAGAIRG